MIYVQDIKCPLCNGTMKCTGYSVDHVGLDGYNSYVAKYRGKVPCQHTLTITSNEKDGFIRYVKD